MISSYFNYLLFITNFHFQILASAASNVRTQSPELQKTAANGAGSGAHSVQFAVNIVTRNQNSITTISNHVGAALQNQDHYVTSLERRS
jgi:hypothetical protein